MNRIAHLTAAAFLLAAGAVCTTPDAQSASPRKPENVDRIIAGKTTANEVRELLGPPARTLKRRANQGEDWGYPYGGNYEPRIVWVRISPDGMVREVSDTADFDRDKRYRGI